MRALHLKQGGVKFLGSYPAAGPAHAEGGEHHDARWNAAQAWVARLQTMIEP
jgi:prephenate dehydratase